MFVNVAAAAVTAVLALSSGRNIFQTVSISRQQHQGDNHVLTRHQILPEDATETVVSKLQAMNRKELLQLYFLSTSPKDLSQIQGAWDGRLLDNNGWVMVRIVQGMKHVTYSLRRWISV